MIQEIRALEMAGHATWPAFEEEWIGDWLIRAARGMSRRNNSVTPMGDPGMPVATAIARCEAWFEDRDIPSIFRFTDLAPPDLEGVLERRGYRLEDSTSVMATEIGPTEVDAHIVVCGEPRPSWMDVMVAERDRGPEHRRTVERLLNGTDNAGGYAEYVIDGSTVAVGSMAVAGEHAAIFNMNTLPPHRRRGLATAILRALLARAAELGARTAMLQVRLDNPGAIALYEREGFTPRYEYWYRQRRPT